MSNEAIPMSETQSAWMVVKRGEPRDALAFKTDVPIPKPKSGEVLVRVRAAALNPAGWKIMGTFSNAFAKRPHPAEYDLAGVIVDASDTPFTNGDEVMGFIDLHLQRSSHQGALAQYATLPKDHVTLKPAKLSWEEAAALPLAALTAVQALRLGGYDPAHMRTHDLSPTTPDSIFISGGSTSVGIYAIQLAKSLSLHVTTSASARNEAFVRKLGADAFLDYKARPLAEQIIECPPEPRFGMVLDAVGLLDTALYVKSGAYMKKRGVYVTTGPWPDEDGWCGLLGRWAGPLLWPWVLGGVATPWKLVHVKNDEEDMKTLCMLIERGALRPYVDSTYEFGSALDAYDRLIRGPVTGKVVVKIDDGASKA